MTSLNLNSGDKSSRGGLEVEQWSDNRIFFISVDQSSLGVCMSILEIKGSHFHRVNTSSLDFPPSM